MPWSLGERHDISVLAANPLFAKVAESRLRLERRRKINAAQGKAVEIVPLAKDAVAIGAKVLWMQLGIRNDEAAKIAIDAGLEVVMDRCVKIEHARLFGGLNWAGVNTGVISARRPV